MMRTEAKTILERLRKKAEYEEEWTDRGPLLREAIANIEELERGLASKIGPDWREALPYESELELRGVVAELTQSVYRWQDAYVEALERLRTAAAEIEWRREAMEKSPAPHRHEWNEAGICGCGEYELTVSQPVATPSHSETTVVTVPWRGVRMHGGRSNFVSFEPHDTACPRCGGTGRMEKVSPCPYCKGTGRE